MLSVLSFSGFFLANSKLKKKLTLNKTKHTRKKKNTHRAVEINPARFELLKGNVKKSVARSAHKTKTVRFFNADFLDVLEAERGAIGAKRPVVFIDPPWGGEAYKKKVIGFISVTCVFYGRLFVGDVFTRGISVKVQGTVWETIGWRVFPPGSVG